MSTFTAENQFLPVVVAAMFLIYDRRWRVRLRTPGFPAAWLLCLLALPDFLLKIPSTPYPTTGAYWIDQYPSMESTLSWFHGFYQDLPAAVLITAAAGLCCGLYVRGRDFWFLSLWLLFYLFIFFVKGMYTHYNYYLYAILILLAAHHLLIPLRAFWDYLRRGRQNEREWT